MMGDAGFTKQGRWSAGSLIAGSVRIAPVMGWE
jgi:hypothetical protein